MTRTISDCAVAVVGGAGFLGSHLVRHLANDRGCRVHIIDNLVVGRREFLNGAHHQFHHHDITQSEEYLQRLFVRERVKYVFNYAAYPYIPDSYARPKLVSNVNYMGAINVINAAHEADCDGILQVSSAEIYGEGLKLVESEHHPHEPQEWKQGLPLNEETEVKPRSTYGAAKAAVDTYCQVAYMERQVPVIALRQFNCIGERETHPYVVPEIISQLSHQKQGWKDNVALVNLGNNSVRDFMYAGDAVETAVRLLERGELGSVYNLGSEQGIKIYELADMIGKLMGFQSVQVAQDKKRVRLWEIWYLQSDNSKISKAVGGLTIHGLEYGLRKTIDYFLANGGRWVWQENTRASV